MGFEPFVVALSAVNDVAVLRNERTQKKRIILLKPRAVQ